LFLAFVSPYSFTQSAVQTEAHISWQHLVPTVSEFSEVARFGNLVAFMDDSGTVHFYRPSSDTSRGFGLDMKLAFELELPVESSEWQSTTVEDAVVADDMLWVMYGYYVRIGENTVRPMRQVFAVSLLGETSARVVSESIMEGSSALSLAYHDGYLYADAYSAGVSVMEIAPDHTLLVIDHVPLQSETRGVTVSDGYLFASDLHRGLVAIDINEPRRPAVIASVDTGRTWGAIVRGGIAFVVRNRGLSIVDVSDPSSPTALGSETWEYMGDARGFGELANGYFIVQRRSGRRNPRLEVFDVADPSAVVLKQTLEIDRRTPVVYLPEWDVLVTSDGIVYRFLP
jgi:hypothetical protein